MEFRLVFSVLAEYDIWYDGNLYPLYKVEEKYYQINSGSCYLKFLIWLVGCRVFTGTVNRRHWYHAYCMIEIYMAPRDS